jgi:hypothetical protein
MGQLPEKNSSVDVLTLSAMHDTAIRSYYSWQLLSELSSSQKQNFVDMLSLVLGIFASIAGIVGVIQLPQVGVPIGVGTILAVIAIAVYWMSLRSQLRDSEVLSYGNWLAIVMDQLLKYSSQLELLNTCTDQDTQFARHFRDSTVIALRASRKQFDEVAAELVREHKYNEILEEFGYTDREIKSLLEEIDKLVKRI